MLEKLESSLFDCLRDDSPSICKILQKDVKKRKGMRGVTDKNTPLFYLLIVFELVSIFCDLKNFFHEKKREPQKRAHVFNMFTSLCMLTWWCLIPHLLQ